MSTSNDKQSRIGWNKALAVWWSFIWRGVIYGVLSGAILGGIAGSFANTPEQGAVYGGVAGWIASIPASMFALKQAISKHLASLAALVHESS